jgi:beta-lactam-binding protein with PASTA domain
MNTTAIKMFAAAAALVAASVGVVPAANADWFTGNPAYGPGATGLSAPVQAPSYGRAQTVDVNDANQTIYSLESATTSASLGPYKIARRTSTGALDPTFGNGGVLTSFQNSGNNAYHFQGLCIDPLTHNLVVVGSYTNNLGVSATVIERLFPPASNGAAALDPSFNPSGTTPGVLTVNGPLNTLQCSVTGEQSIIVAGRPGATSNTAMIARVLVGGTLDSSFGTSGVVTVTLPGGQIWEGGGIVWNSSQTITPDIIIGGDTYPAGSPTMKTAGLIAIDRCTGQPDPNFNGTGFLSVPTLDTFNFATTLFGAILPNGDVLAAFVTNDNLYNVDLVEWTYPLAAGQAPLSTRPGAITLPTNITIGITGNDTPMRQFDGSILISGQNKSAQEVLFQLAGTGSLGFTVAAPAMVNCPVPVAVPNVVGMTQAAASSAITAANLTVGTVTMQASSTVASGSVISENPVAGTIVSSGSAVNIVVSTGPGQVAVPNVVGQMQAAASSAITAAGLTVGTVMMQSSSTVASGVVISESPAAGMMVTSGSAVNLVVSSGPAQVAVPNVVGQTQAAATTAITAAGLTVGTVTMQSSSAVASGSVISESPAAGTIVNSGSAVNLVVSTGIAQVAVPNVVGTTQAAATTAITAAGLTVGTVTMVSSSTVAAGNVISESPAANTMVATGSAVNLVVSTGPAMVAVPNVVGQAQAAATTAITAAALTLGTVTMQSSSTVASGSVISESPAAGTSVLVGAAVNLTVSTGPAQVAVPTVSGQTQAAATAAITAAGLTLGTVTMQSSSTVASGSVISESPAAGTNVTTGSAVNLDVSSGPAPSSRGGGGAFDLITLGALLSITLIRASRRGRTIAR